MTQSKDFNLQEIDGKLYNNTQQIVLEIMHELLQSPEYNHVCSCEKCLLDIASYALNRLPAKYIVAPTEDLHSKIINFEHRINDDTLSMVKKAIKVVSQNPRH